MDSVILPKKIVEKEKTKIISTSMEVYSTDRNKEKEAATVKEDFAP